MKKGCVMFSVVAVALLLTVLEASALAGGSSRRGGGPNGNGDSQDITASVPEPSTLYAVGTGLALLGGAGWYIRRRK